MVIVASDTMQSLIQRLYKPIVGVVAKRIKKTVTSLGRIGNSWKDAGYLGPFG